MTVKHGRVHTEDASLLQASFSSVSALVALQLFSRLFTFVLNQALFRIASPKAFGTVAIQFEFLLSTLLFLSREGVRNALLRAWPSDDERRGARANLALLPSMLGIPLAIIAGVGYSLLAGHETTSQPGFTLSIGIYALAAVVELLSEPMHSR
jgi:oligosaccharide translocation protein RFT1